MSWDTGARRCVCEEHVPGAPQLWKKHAKGDVVETLTSLDIDCETANRCLREAGLSPLHNIRRVVRLEELPLLGTGKADYRALKATLN